ncbi:MAG: fructose-bisphosphatase class III [Candidatus Binatia bacterium]
MNKYGRSPAKPTEQELAMLRQLSRQFPSADVAVAEIARLGAQLTLPRGTIHVLSDVHGEYAKLRHIINNASGTLRPLIERLFADRLSTVERQRFLSLIFYPRETLQYLEPTLDRPDQLRTFVRRVLGHLFEVIRVLAGRCSLTHVAEVFPVVYRQLFQELLWAPSGALGSAYTDAIVDALVRQGTALRVIRLAARALRDLAINELIVAGDCFDRGPRSDRVLSYLQRQANVSFTWGNHDMAWIGARLGQEALIAHVLRLSLRYRRLSQLEEGYGLTMQPLEHLVRSVYGDDPATCFKTRGTGLREDLMMARMQKAAAIMQFKLEGQTIERNSEMAMEHRRLLHRIDRTAGTIEIDGQIYPLRDTFFPTLDPAHPYELSREERACMHRLRQSFLASRPLWRHVRFLVERGAMALRRDDHLIFHGCVPVDDDGEFLAFEVDGARRRGRALFEAIEAVVFRALERPNQKDLDLFWYLWCGPRSPLFGKDRITTLERDLVSDPRTHVETKNPYFRLIHEVAFCERVLAEFGVDPQHGMIVNGHVPVKLEAGESPVKRSGRAITIDGAFSEAYGDHGYTLVIDADRTFLALHHHFDSVEAAVRDGVDIIPAVSVVREYTTPRRLADTQRGSQIRSDIALLERLAAAYRRNELHTH